MTYVTVGCCSRCGSPKWAPSVWHGVIPPPVTTSCNCFGSSVPSTWTTTTISPTISPLTTTTITANPPEKEGMKKALSSLGDEFEKAELEEKEETVLEKVLDKLDKIEKRLTTLETSQSKFRPTASPPVEDLSSKRKGGTVSKLKQVLLKG